MSEVKDENLETTKMGTDAKDQNCQGAIPSTSNSVVEDTKIPKPKRSASCSVLDCPTGLRSHPEERHPTYHFPYDPAVEKEWVDILKRDFPNGTANARVCARHFLPNDFVPDEENLTQKGKRKLRPSLKWNAIPTQNLCSESPKRVLGRKFSKRSRSPKNEPPKVKKNSETQELVKEHIARLSSENRVLRYNPYDVMGSLHHDHLYLAVCIWLFVYR